jgi:hypothetical protein
MPMIIAAARLFVIWRERQLALARKQAANGAAATLRAP